MYTLIVSLQVRPEKRDRFLAAITQNAAASVRDEPGCLRFDVMEHAQQPNQFYFYEVYRDTDGFAAHKAAPHFGGLAPGRSRVRGAGQSGQHLLRHHRQPRRRGVGMTAVSPAHRPEGQPMSSTSSP